MNLQKIVLSLIFSILFLQLTAQTPFLPLNVKDFGALGNKDTKATSAIQKAIDACEKQGGGTVYFPPGDYTSGSIQLKNNVTIWLEAGATLYASQEAEDYDINSTWGRPVLIFSDSVHHIGIRGKGRIHGQARRTYEDLKAVDKFIADITKNAEEAGVEMKMYYKVKPWVRLVVLERSTDITIEDISLIESTSWTLDLKQCERVFIRGIYVASSLESGVNSDGIDVDGCKNVTISDCVVITGDDAIVLKANYSKKGNYDCENITVTNCVVSSTSTGLKLGTESYGDYRHITFSNCVVRNSNRGLSIVIRDGATVEDVIFSNITIETNRRHFNWWGSGDAIWLVVRKRRPNSRLGTMKNILFENIIAHGQGSSRIEGYAPDSLHPEGRKLENIQFRNVQLTMSAENYLDKRADHAFEAHDVDGLVLDNVSVKWDTEKTEPKWGNALNFYRVNDLKISDFRGRQGLLDSNSPVIGLSDVKKALITDIEADEGAKTLIGISGKETENIRLRDLDPFEVTKKKIEISKEVPSSAVIKLN